MVQDGRRSSAAGIRSGDQPGDADFRRVWRVVVIGRHAVVVVGRQVIVVVSGLRAPDAVPRNGDVTAIGVLKDIADILQ